MIGRLSGESKASAKSLPVEILCAEGGVNKKLKKLDKSYAVDTANQLYAYLARFLDYSFKKSLTIEQYIAGFHSRLDKIATLNLDNKLKVYLLLHQATFPQHHKNMIVGAASGSYDVMRLTASLLDAYIHTGPVASTMASRNTTTHPLLNEARQNNLQNERSDSNPQSSSVTPTFYTFKTSSAPSSNDGAILDSGACASVVGKNSLYKALNALNIKGIPDAKQILDYHRFGDHTDQHRTICVVPFPFKYTN